MVFITVPLKGVKANKVDIFSSEEYLKVYFVRNGNIYKVLREATKTVSHY